VKETHATKEELNLGDRLHFQFGEDYHVKIVRKESNVGQKVEQSPTVVSGSQEPFQAL